MTSEAYLVLVFFVAMVRFPLVRVLEGWNVEWKNIRKPTGKWTREILLWL